MPNTPSSGTISIGDIKNAFPSINSGSLNAYRGQTWYTPASSGTGTFSAGEIALSDFYNKTGTQPIPIITTQSIAVFPWGYHLGGCYGTGINNLVVTIGSTYGIVATATGWAADYTVVSPGYIGNWSPSGNVPGGTIVTTSTLATAANIVNQSTLIPNSSFNGSGVNTYSAGRDTNAIRANTTWNGTTFILTIQYDCKGGGTGWGTTLYSASVPITWT